MFWRSGVGQRSDFLFVCLNGAGHDFRVCAAEGLCFWKYFHPSYPIDDSGEECYPHINRFIISRRRKGADMKKTYDPQPIDTSDVKLDADITALGEQIAANTHDVWARGKLDEGWTYADTLDRDKKTHPLLVPYEELSESDKDYDRRTSEEALKLVLKLGFDIVKRR